MTIRRIPSDFLVEERLNARVREAISPRRAAHAVWRLEKESLTTPDALAEFARALGVRPGVIDFAGLKDKHARTTQHLSVPARELSADPAPNPVGRSWTARFLGWSPEPVLAAAIDGNRFTLVVRDLTRARTTEMDRRADLLRDASGGLVVLNYFGDQRFGSARHGKGFAARCLIRGDFEGALRLLIGTPARKDTGKARQFTRLCAQKWGDWSSIVREAPRVPERRAVEVLARGRSFKDAFTALPAITQTMAVESYQSHLWNATARFCARTIDADPLRTEDDFGEMLFPRADRVSEPWRDLEVPLMDGSTAIEGPWAPGAIEALEGEGIGVGDLRVPGLRRPHFGEAMRPLFGRAAGLEMSEPERDDLAPGGRRLKRTVRFDLPRGAYATVVLRALGE